MSCPLHPPPSHTLRLEGKTRSFSLSLSAHDTGHAQAQAKDIARALGADGMHLLYETHETTRISEFFRALAVSDFSHKECCIWDGSITSNSPCFYALGKRHYIRDITMKYLDIPYGRTVCKTKCNHKLCVNPYHFEYVCDPNSKLSCSDKKMLVLWAGQGVPINQIAQALNVSKSTVYRNLNHERVLVGTSSH